MNMTMDNMSHQVNLPEWVLLASAIWFFAGACFYLYRIIFVKEVQAVYGYWDLENEVGHSICMLGMVTMLAFPLLPIPIVVWTWLLAAAAVWFVIRAVSWGRKLPYNKWWWDWTHVGMLGSMAIMFASVTSTWVLIMTGAFWLWFTGLYAYEIYHDSKSGQVLYIGSDLAHLTMGIMMLAMTIAPSIFMASMPMC